MRTQGGEEGGVRYRGQEEIMPEKHSRLVPGGRAVWHTERLWELARGLPMRMVAVEDIPELDQDCWFGSAHVPTCRAVAQHAQRIRDADLSYPIILAADGGLMDGGHRLAKALLEGQVEVRAVQFTVDPEPDYVIPVEDEATGVR
ncbi:MAG: hypothetical protein QM589_14200 [Thermomicrobiales bacterium]